MRKAGQAEARRESSVSIGHQELLSARAGELAGAHGGAEHVALLTGGGDRHYAFGLASSLAAKGVSIDFVAGDDLDTTDIHAIPKLRFLRFRRNAERGAGLIAKSTRTLAYYCRLVHYAATCRPKVFHILWNNKFEYFDRTLLMLYYRLLGKRILLTAHNVNAGDRDGTDSWLNRITLKIQYRLSHHVFVHTDSMRRELVDGYGLRPEAITVIRYGVNNAVPTTALTREEARHRLGLSPDHRVLLFFGNVAAYKGLEYLLSAFERLAAQHGEYRLIIAGRLKNPGDAYGSQVREQLAHPVVKERTILKMEFIPDEVIEVFFKACDVALLPYTKIFQSGVLFLAYSFGIPVVVSDVGSLREDVLEGETGFVCKPQDVADLAQAIERFFASDLYRNREAASERILHYVKEHHSWDSVGEKTRSAYFAASGT